MINLIINTQPDDETCGPTSLHSIYRYYGESISLDDVLHTVERTQNGGTLAALLGKHALQRGYQALLYIYDLEVFDPSWFYKGHADSSMLQDKLHSQLKIKSKVRLRTATKAYLDFLELGGIVAFKDLSINLLKEYFSLKQPIITGLSATYLYNTYREYYTKNDRSVYDDIRGEPCGHFVVLCGYDETKRHIVVADPHRENPISHNNYYKVSSSRLINAIMLGVLTYDANLLIIKPR